MRLIPSQKIPLILFVASLLLRISLISKGPYSVDCLGMALLSQKTLETGQLQYFFGSGYPLTILLGSVFIFFARIFNILDPVVPFNAMSVVFSALCVPVLYSLAKRMFDETTALLSSLMFSVSPIFLGISVYGTSHAPCLFFLLAGVFFLLHYKENPHTRYLWISAVSFGLAGGARLQDMLLMIVPVCVFYFWKKGKESRFPPEGRENVKNFTIFCLAAFLTTAVFYLPYFLGERGTPYLEQLFSYQQRSLIKSFSLLDLGLSFKFLSMTFSPPGLLIAVLGLAFFIRRDIRLFFFFLLWILIPLMLFANLHTTAPRFHVLILPPFLIAQGYLFARLLKINSLFRGISSLVYSVVFLATFLSIYPLVHFRHNNALLPDYARWVAQKTGQNARIIVGDDILFIKYYAKREILRKPMKAFVLTDEEMEKFKQDLDKLLEDNIPVYITYVGLYDYDPAGKFSRFIIQNYHLEYIGEKAYEDWHKGAIVRKVFLTPMLRIRKKAAHNA